MPFECHNNSVLDGLLDALCDKCAVNQWEIEIAGELLCEECAAKITQEENA